MKKSLKKLELKKQKISVLTTQEKSNIKAGEADFFNSRLLCTQTMADRGCTSHSECNNKEKTSVVILCL